MKGGIEMRVGKIALLGSTLLLAATLSGAPASAAGGQPWSSTKEVPLALCAVDSSPQVCDPAQVQKIRVGPGKKIHVTRLRYTAATTHCSPGRLLISLNGRSLGATDWVEAGQETTVELLDVTLRHRRGGKAHKFSYRMQGKVGGCNSGAVGSWAGDIKLSGKKQPA